MERFKTKVQIIKIGDIMNTIDVVCNNRFCFTYDQCARDGTDECLYCAHGDSHGNCGILDVSECVITKVKKRNLNDGYKKIRFAKESKHPKVRLGLLKIFQEVYSESMECNVVVYQIDEPNNRIWAQRKSCKPSKCFFVKHLDINDISEKREV